jgi:hypothetical protein
MSAQENEALVRRYFEEVWGKGNLAAVDDFMGVASGPRAGREGVLYA